ncbi:hypothetical protein RFL32_12075, partial [Streptococcus suis]|uniref:hypothetical protein n=1 Tax=Streptococcus suis TaxID=1307 RepID=UPI002FC58D68
DGVVSALKQPFFSKNSKKDKHQNDVCLQSEALINQDFPHINQYPPCRNFIAKHVVVCFKKYADFSYFCYIFDLSILIF